MIETETSPVYTMVLEVALQDLRELAKLEEALDSKADELGVTCSIRPSDTEEL